MRSLAAANITQRLWAQVSPTSTTIPPHHRRRLKTFCTALHQPHMKPALRLYIPKLRAPPIHYSKLLRLHVHWPRKLLVHRSIYWIQQLPRFIFNPTLSMPQNLTVSTRPESIPTPSFPPTKEETLQSLDRPKWNMACHLDSKASSQACTAPGQDLCSHHSLRCGNPVFLHRSTIRKRCSAVHPWGTCITTLGKLLITNYSDTLIPNLAYRSSCISRCRTLRHRTIRNFRGLNMIEKNLFSLKIKHIVVLVTRSSL